MATVLHSSPLGFFTTTTTVGAQFDFTLENILLDRGKVVHVEPRTYGDPPKHLTVWVYRRGPNGEIPGPDAPPVAVLAVAATVGSRTVDPTGIYCEVRKAEYGPTHNWIAQVKVGGLTPATPWLIRCASGRIEGAGAENLGRFGDVCVDTLSRKQDLLKGAIDGGQQPIGSQVHKG